jgi:hypothetical protein
MFIDERLPTLRQYLGIAEKHIIQINFIVFQHFIDKQPARSNKM